ncbi:MAG TPA: hypothetical protein VGB53_02000 [Rubricoccaceae bacterium]
MSDDAELIDALSGRLEAAEATLTEVRGIVPGLVETVHAISGQVGNNDVWVAAADKQLDRLAAAVDGPPHLDGLRSEVARLTAATDDSGPSWSWLNPGTWWERAGADNAQAAFKVFRGIVLLFAGLWLLYKAVTLGERQVEANERRANAAEDAAKAAASQAARPQPEAVQITLPEGAVVEDGADTVDSSPAP